MLRAGSGTRRHPPRALMNARTKSAPVPAAFQAHDPAEPRRLEVAGRHEDLLALQAVQQRPARLARQLGVHVGARAPVGLLDLHRGVGGVAEHERALALRGDEEAHVPRRVAGRGHRGQLAGEAVLAVHQLDQAELLQRPHAGRRVGIALGLDVGPAARLQVRGAHPVARLREGRDLPLALAPQVPADVIAVQVCHHDHVHVLRAHAVGLQVVQQPAPGRVGRVGRPRARDRCPRGSSARRTGSGRSRG